MGTHFGAWYPLSKGCKPDTVAKAFYSVPSPMANDSAFCRNEQSAMGNFAMADYDTRRVSSTAEPTF